MKVLKITENEDGSADVKLDLTKEEVSMLLEDSILRAIKLGMEADGIMLGSTPDVEQEKRVDPET